MNVLNMVINPVWPTGPCLSSAVRLKRSVIRPPSFITKTRENIPHSLFFHERVEGHSLSLTNMERDSTRPCCIYLSNNMHHDASIQLNIGKVYPSELLSVQDQTNIVSKHNTEIVNHLQKLTAFLASKLVH